MTMLVNGLQAMTDGLATVSQASDYLQGLHWYSPVNWTVLAQEVRQADFVGQVQRAWSNFVQTGQIWAMLIGIVIGFVFRGVRRG